MSAKARKRLVRRARTTRRQFVKTAAASPLAVVLGLSAGLGTEQERKLPDVVFITIEDVSPHRFGCYGNEVCKTPNVDRLAEQGLKFDLAHCNAPPSPTRPSMCFPSRATSRCFSPWDTASPTWP